MHSIVNVLEDPGGFGTARWISVRSDRRRTWSDKMKKLAISSPLVSSEIWCHVAYHNPESDAVDGGHILLLHWAHRCLKREGIKLPKSLQQYLGTGFPC